MRGADSTDRASNQVGRWMDHGMAEVEGFGEGPGDSPYSTEESGLADSQNLRISANSDHFQRILAQILAHFSGR